MKHDSGWWWPEREIHMIEWMANPRNRVALNGRMAYQGSKQLALRELLTARPRRVAVDIGAHVGTWAWNLAHWFDVVHCFEPVAEHRACLERNLFDDPSRPACDVRIHACALGDTEGKVHAMADPGDPEHSTGGTYMADGGDIPIYPLDKFNLDNVDLIKIDVEGRELEVCRGARETILRCEPVIVIEQKDREARNFGKPAKEALEYLKKLGMVEIRAPLAGDYFMGFRHE